jgi:hypothetical protein
MEVRHASSVTPRDLWKCVTGDVTDEGKNMKARSRILLATEPHIYIHVEDTATAKDAWNNLARTFEDAGQNNRIALMRALQARSHGRA